MVYNIKLEIIERLEISDITKYHFDYKATDETLLELAVSKFQEYCAGWYYIPKRGISRDNPAPYSKANLKTAEHHLRTNETSFEYNAAFNPFVDSDDIKTDLQSDTTSQFNSSEKDNVKSCFLKTTMENKFEQSMKKFEATLLSNNSKEITKIYKIIEKKRKTK